MGILRRLSRQPESAKRLSKREQSSPVNGKQSGSNNPDSRPGPLSADHPRQLRHQEPEHQLPGPAPLGEQADHPYTRTSSSTMNTMATASVSSAKMMVAALHGCPRISLIARSRTNRATSIHLTEA